MPMSDTTYVTDEPAKVPVSFWIVTALGALWNAYGAYDYLMTRTENMKYLSQMGDPQVMLDWIHTFPLWAQVGWGFGVWGSVLGSVLMLIRSRHAVSAFLVSLAGAVVSLGYQLTHAVPSELDTTFNKVIPLVIIAIVAGLWWYCRRAAAKGYLR